MDSRFRQAAAADLLEQADVLRAAGADAAGQAGASLDGGVEVVIAPPPACVNGAQAPAPPRPEEEAWR